jgi:hypothetical protein
MHNFIISFLQIYHQMPTVKLCTYTRGFYPTVWGQHIFTVIGIYLIIVDGKIVKRSFSEMAYNKTGEFQGEFDALKAGLEWITENMTSHRDINVDVMFCGSRRTECKTIVDRDLPFPVTVSHLVGIFNKVSYYSVSRIMINNGENDDPEDAERFDIYDMASNVFLLLYGDSDPKHEVIHRFDEDGIQRQILVGQPELRWDDGVPKSMWKWS